METELRPIERQRIYDTIVEQIRNLITGGIYKPGQALPPERELTRILGVGRTSVREALRILEAMNLIEIRAGYGIYVKENIEIPGRLINFATLIQDNGYHSDLMEARELIESQIAFLAAESATPEDIVELESIVERQISFSESGEKSVEENINFHLSLTQVTGNHVLIELQQIFFRLSHDMIADLFRIPGRNCESAKQHQAILEAVKEHRPTDAHRLMLEHLRSRYKLPNLDS